MSQRDLSAVKKPAKPNSSAEQIYLLEVIIDKINVVKEGILETFQESAQSPSATKVDDDENQSPDKAPKQGPLKVLVKFHDFPTIEIEEKDFKKTKDSGDKDTEDTSEPSRSAGSLEKAATTSKRSTGDKTKRENKFTSGKSCLFPMAPKELMNVIRKCQVEFQVHRDATDKEPAHRVGLFRIELGQDFIDAVALANTSVVLPLSAFVEGSFNLTNVFGDVTGRATLLVRLSCFGGSIFTQFVHVKGSKGFKLTSEGSTMAITDSKVVGRANSDVKLADARVPYLTSEEEMLGMYTKQLAADNKFKVSVPWRKLYEQPIAPYVCEAKWLFKDRKSAECEAKLAGSDCPQLPNPPCPSKKTLPPGDESFGEELQKALQFHQPAIAGGMFDCDPYRKRPAPTKCCVPPEFGSALPEVVAKLLPGQRGTGKGVLDIPPGTKFPCQFGQTWVSEAQPCHCSPNVKRGFQKAAACSSQSQPSPRGCCQDRSGQQTDNLCACLLACQERAQGYPTIEQAPPHLKGCPSKTQLNPPSKCNPDSNSPTAGTSRCPHTAMANCFPTSSTRFPPNDSSSSPPNIKCVPCPYKCDKTGTKKQVGDGKSCENMSDLNQKNLELVLRSLRSDTSCPPCRESKKKAKAKCTCPKTPRELSVSHDILKCECNNIMTALKPIDPLSICSPLPPMKQRLSDCSPCPPVAIQLPAPCPECPLATLLKNTDQDSQELDVLQTICAELHKTVETNKNKNVAESPEKSSAGVEKDPSASAVPPDSPVKGQVASSPNTSPSPPGSQPKDGPTTAEQAQTTVPTESVPPSTALTDSSFRGSPDEQAYPEMMSEASTSSHPTKRAKHHAKVKRSAKPVPSAPPTEIAEKEMKLNYTATAGLYPGFVIGHKHCVPQVRLVPKRMGWLWNIKYGDSFSKPGRGWRPGSIQTNVMKVMATAKTSTNTKQSKDKRGVKSARSGEQTKKTEATRVMAAGDSPMFLPIDQTPTLHLHKKHGTYFVSLNPPKDPRKALRPKKKKLNPKGELVDESASDDSRPVQFMINPRDPDNLNLNPELFETDDTSTNSEDSYQIEIDAPSTLRNRQPVPIKRDLQIQVTEADFVDPAKAVSIEKEPPQVKTIAAVSKGKKKKSGASRGSKAGKNKKKSSVAKAK